MTVDCMPSRAGFDFGRFFQVVRTIIFPPYRTRREHHNSHSAQGHCYSNSSHANCNKYHYSNSCRGAVRHTSQESHRLRRTLSHHFNPPIRAPSGRGFFALVLFARVAGHALRVRSATPYYIARFRNGSDAPRAPQAAPSARAPPPQSEPREPQEAPLPQCRPRSGL